MFYLIDKPLNITSFDVLRQLRKHLGIKKMGHTGTLDPLATGLLLVATEKSTKLIHLLEKSEKIYTCTIHFDGNSDSLDRGTPVVPCESSDFSHISDIEIENFLVSQKTQIPPSYSALHVNGVRAYDLARQGVLVSFEERPITVKYAKVLARDMQSITLEIHISSGGYIRSFAQVLGDFLGCQGGYISALRRTHIITSFGILSLEQSSTIEVPIPLKEGVIFPSIPEKEIDIQEALCAKQGKLLSLPYTEPYIFLKHPDTYRSLVQASENGYTIYKNDV